MIGRRGFVAASALLVAVACGCSSDDDNGAPSASGSSPTSASASATTVAATSDPSTTDAPETTIGGPPEGSDTTVYERGDIDEGLRPFISQATDDLAARLGIDATEIEALSAVLVTWPDSSLGCPQPGMQYAQVLTDGSIIELGVGEGDDLVVYRYHTGGSSGPFLCDQPLDRKPAAGG